MTTFRRYLRRLDTAARWTALITLPVVALLSLAVEVGMRGAS